MVKKIVYNLVLLLKPCSSLTFQENLNTFIKQKITSETS